MTINHPNFGELPEGRVVIFDTTLRDGELAVFRTAGAQPERIRVSGGFAEVGDRGLTVLAESAGEAA